MADEGVPEKNLFVFRPVVPVQGTQLFVHGIDQVRILADGLSLPVTGLFFDPLTVQ